MFGAPILFEHFENCTQNGNDPYKTGKYIKCCSDTKPVLKEWDNNGRNYFKCIGDTPLNLCANVKCPSGQHCENGKCVTDSTGSNTTNIYNGNVTAKVTSVQYLNLEKDGDFRSENNIGIINNANYHSHNVSFSKENIILNVEGLDKDHRNTISSGRIISNKAYHHGVFIISAIVPKCHNLFPAIWLVAPFIDKNQQKRECYIEIDIMETQNMSDRGSANIVLPFINNRKCITKDTMWKNGIYGSRYIPNNYFVQNKPNNCMWDKHTFVLYWENETIVVWVDPKYDYNASAGTIDINSSKKDTFKVYTLENTPLWKQSINNVGKNPFNQPLNIVMNIASTENAKASAAGSTMTISKVLYFPLQK